jgi:REP element-mobilizing transposase RayT
MPNHYHVLVAIKKRKDLSVWMREIGRNYTIYMNRKYSLVGRIFQGPYQKKKIDDFIYFRTLVQYMRDNPKELLYSKHLSELIENRKLIEYYDFFLVTKSLP